ncbi:hypothetical protein [Williamsia soli]|uniref:hypothetical protein n=1 Tax=Williamsia soli TaxID=364929 RepID=UPI001A9DFEFB|nr:hypothetical protein [Williamsia soli]
MRNFTYDLAEIPAAITELEDLQLAAETEEARKGIQEEIDQLGGLERRYFDQGVTRYQELKTP